MGEGTGEGVHIPLSICFFKFPLILTFSRREKEKTFSAIC
jgi:hypothetical protein